MGEIKYLLRKLKYKIKLFFQSVYNLVYYFKPIWQDRQFDYIYLDNILYFKLKAVYEYNNKHFNKNYNTYNKLTMIKTNDYYSLKSLDICLLILERKRSNFYYSKFENGQRIESRDNKWLYAIIGKYSLTWWD